MYIDEQGNRWYKGNLHTHTTVSDGQKTPNEVVEMYQKEGYDFLALTDHWNFQAEHQLKDFLLLSGAEYDTGTSPQQGIYHITGIGMEQPAKLQRAPTLTPQRIIDEVHSVGGLAFLAHPAWSMNRGEEVAKLNGLDGCEIYNTTSGLPWNCRPYSGAFVDEMATRGVFLPCTATDDAHWYNGDQTKSYVMVKAAALNREAILGAMRAGDFYASQGPRFSVYVDSYTISVTCTAVKSVVFFTDTVYLPDRAVCGERVTRASCRIRPNMRFVRVEMTDAEGNQAWSSVIPVK